MRPQHCCGCIACAGKLELGVPAPAEVRIRCFVDDIDHLSDNRSCQIIRVVAYGQKRHEYLLLAHFSLSALTQRQLNCLNSTFRILRNECRSSPALDRNRTK
jgi:hypothetical protein